MILDELTEFADASTDVQNAVATDVLVGDVIDLGAVHRDIGNGQTVYVIVTIDTEIDSAGDGASVDFKLASDSTADLATSPTTHVSSGPIAEANLGAGVVAFQAALPIEGNVYERFLGLLIDVSGETVTAGAVNAFLTLDPHGWQSYPDALPAFPA